MPVHELLVFVTFTQNVSNNTPTLTYQAKVARGLQFGMCLHPHQNFKYASSVGSGESVHMHRLAWAYVARQSDKYQIPMCWAKLLTNQWLLIKTSETKRFEMTFYFFVCSTR